MKSRHRWAGYIVIGILLLVLLVFPFLFDDVRQIASPESVRELLLKAGPFGYGLLILFLLASIPLPIPSTPIILTGGYIYGTIIGSTVSLIAIIIGSSVSFYLVRHFGEPILEKMVDKHHILHFNHVFKRRGLMAAFISYAVPIFPSDSMSMLLGLTRISYGTFLLLVVAGHIPRVFLINSLGSDLYAGFSVWTIVVLVVSSLLILTAVFREKIKKFAFKELHELEAEAVKIEHEIEREARKIENEVEREVIKVERKWFK